MPSAVLDASAILAVVNRERGWEQAKPELDDSIVSSVNLAEVVTILTLDHAPPGAIAEVLVELGLAVEPFDERRAMAAGTLVEKTRRFGLSLADRACLALALELERKVVTADRTWEKIDIGVAVQLIR